MKLKKLLCKTFNLTRRPQQHLLVIHKSMLGIDSRERINWFKKTVPRFLDTSTKLLLTPWLNC